MMNRKLFFWLEKLKITRAERYAVSCLITVLVSLLLINTVVKPSSAFDRPYYRTLEQEFQQKTALLKQKNQKLLARYKKPNASIVSVADTLPEDKKSSSKKAFAKVIKAVGKPININTADAKSLQSLYGIGASYAQHIIDYRRKNGAFKSKQDLLNVKGIGKARLKKIKPFIILSGYSSSSADTIQVYRTAEKKTSPSHKSKSEAQTIININAANVKTLQKLPGIGPAYARRIVAYRQENTTFTTKDELLKIKGIGKKRLAKIKPFIKLRGQD